MSTTLNYFGELVRKRCERQPDKVAVAYGEGFRLTYGELEYRVETTARKLAAFREPGDIIEIHPSDDVDLIVTYLAGMRSAIISDLGPSHLECSLQVTSDNVQRLKRPSLASDEIDGIDAPSVIVRTSGTSGTPKRTLHDASGLLSGVWNTGALIDEALTPEGVSSRPSGGADMAEALLAREPLGLTYLVGMPMRSIGGLTVLNRALATGETLVLPSSTRAVDIAGACAAGLPISTLGLPPFTAQQLLRLWERGQAPIPTGILSCGIGGAGVLPSICEQLESVLSVPVTCAFGTTELGGVSLMSRPWDPPQLRWHSVGTPLPGVEATIEAGDGFGELMVASPAAMIGIIDAENRLIRSVQPLGTGDLAWMGEAGEFRVEGRADFMIMRGGHKVDPVRVELALETEPGVNRAAVLGRPNPVTGETDVVALVEVSDLMVVGALRGRCVDLLQAYEVPRSIRVVHAIPLTRDGKPSRAQLPTLLE